MFVTLIQDIKQAIEGSSEIGHITDPAVNALAKIMFDAIKPHEKKPLTPMILLEVQRKVADGIVKQAKRFTSSDDFGAPLETFKQTADEMKQKRPLSEQDMKDPSKHPIKERTLRLYGQGSLTCGHAVKIDPYLFMPNP